MTEWVVYLGGAPAVAVVASRHGRNPIVWASLTLFASWVTSFALSLAGGLLAPSDSAALVMVTLAPIGAFAATVGVGLLAARRVEARDGDVEAPIATPSEPEALSMVRVAPDGGDVSESTCSLVLGERRLTLTGPGAGRRSLAYRIVTATRIDDEGVRLAWESGDGAHVEVLLRASADDPDARRKAAQKIVAHVEAKRAGA